MGAVYDRGKCLFLDDEKVYQYNGTNQWRLMTNKDFEIKFQKVVDFTVVLVIYFFLPYAYIVQS